MSIEFVRPASILVDYKNSPKDNIIQLEVYQSVIVSFFPLGRYACIYVNNNQLGKESLFCFVTYSSLSREIKVGTNAEAMEEGDLSTCSSRLGST